jgi:hypothetical protein
LVEQKTNEVLDIPILDEVLVKSEGKLTSDEDKFTELEQAAMPFDTEYQTTSVEYKRQTIEELFDALNNIYNSTYSDHHRELSAKLHFSESREPKGWFLSYETGHIMVPIQQLERSKGIDTVFSLFHEYGHVIMHSNNLNDNMLVGTRFAHDTKKDEVGATKFAFILMDNLGIDKTKTKDYDRWQRTLEYFDVRNQLEEIYGKKIADQYTEVFRSVDEYEHLTSDAMINSRHQAEIQGAMMNILRVMAKLNNRDIKKRAVNTYETLNKELLAHNDDPLSMAAIKSLQKEISTFK